MRLAERIIRLDKAKTNHFFLSFDIDTIKEAGYPVTTPIIVTNMSRFKDLKVLAEGEVDLGDTLFELN